METARERLLGLITGYRGTQLIRSASLLNICDELARGPRDAADVAAAVHANPALLRRLMRALVGIGVLQEAKDGRFTNTEMGELLRSDLPGNLSAPAVSLTDDHAWAAWAQLHRGIAEGAVPHLLANGTTYWEALKANPEAGARFNAHMVRQTEAFAAQLVSAFDFSQCGTVVDVGGGNGALLAGILSANPGVHGVLFDIEQGLVGAEQYLHKHGVSDRCTTVVGDFLKSSPPPRADCYLLRLILHDWDDPQAMHILESVRRAMAPGSHLLVMDHLLPDRADASTYSRVALNMDIHMFVLFGSRERTESEIRKMLGSSGFEVGRVVPTSPTRIVVARAV